MLRAALAIVLLLAAGAAFAQSYTTKSGVTWEIVGPGTYGPKPGNPSGPGGTFTNQDFHRWHFAKHHPFNPGGFQVGNPANTAMVATRQQVTRAAIGRAMFKAMPIVGSVIAAKEIWDYLECDLTGRCDLGTPKIPQQCLMVVVAGYGDAGCVTSASQAPGRAISFMQATRPSREQWFGGFRCTWQITYSGGVANGSSWNITETGIGSCDNSNYSGQLAVFVEDRGQTLNCPEGKRALRYDGDKCESPTKTQLDENQFANDHFNKVPVAMIPSALTGLDSAGVPFEAGAPDVVGIDPQFIPSATGSSSTRNSDGSQTITERWTRVSQDPLHPGRLKVEEETITRTYPPGATVPSPYSQPPTAPGTPPAPLPPGSTETRSTAPVDIKLCGLPNTPPCKIDEGGTPPPPPSDAMGDPGKDMDPLKAIIQNPQVTDTRWSWSLQLPTGCSALSLPDLFGVSLPPLDVCQWQAQIHDLMSMVWIGVAIFFCAGMVFRTLST